ncbi:UBP1-associated protein 2A [Trifolium repens]|nr:UBP1-associated protein 2A [Trifolium repens]
MSEKKEMEDLEKNSNGGEFVVSMEEIRVLSESLSKPQLVDLLSQLGSKYPSIAQEIQSFANADHDLDSNTNSTTLCSRNLYVENLSLQVTSEILFNYFERHGDIEECVLAHQRQGSKVSRSCFVTYKTLDAAKNAMEHLDQTTLEGKTITIKYVPLRVAPMAEYADPIHRKLFVRDLSLNTTSQTLCDAFKLYGEIEDGNVIVYQDTQKSRRFGYILYKDVKSAQKALRVPSKLIDGRSTLCKLARDEGKCKTSDTSLRKLYIGNLSPKVTDGMLHDYFWSHGDIEECSVVYDKDSYVSRGYGFVTYKTVEAAKEAVNDLHRMTFEGRDIIVKYANPRKGGGGQLSVPPISPTAALPVPPGYTYPQTTAPYAASRYPSFLRGYQTPPRHYYQNQ